VGNETLNPVGDPTVLIPDSPAPEGESEFERFEDLTRKVLTVPKKEVDEKRATG
jgi:hypothetical protein